MDRGVLLTDCASPCSRLRVLRSGLDGRWKQIAAHSRRVEVPRWSLIAVAVFLWWSSAAATLSTDWGHARWEQLSPCGRVRAEATQDDERPQDVLAVVEGLPIRRRQVEHFLRDSLGAKATAPPVRVEWFAAALEQLIDRALVQRAIAAEGYQAGPSEIQLELELLRAELARVGRKLEDFWDEARLTEDDWRAEVAWRIAWQRYLADYVTHERLESFYQAHRRDFDGTEMQVAQILLAKGEDEPALAKAVAQADQIRQDLLEGRQNWNEAVARYSIAPSRENGGDLGWIGRHQPMPATFSAAAFRLEPGEISSPLVSAFGVHLIRCVEVRPGKFLLGDVKDEVRRALTEARFAELAAARRRESIIEYPQGRSP